jgi:PAS domain S-box-containing protein
MGNSLTRAAHLSHYGPMSSQTAPQATDERSAFRQLSPEQRLAHLSALVYCSHDAIFTTDLDDVVLSWNPASEEIYGYSAEEIVGRNAAMLLPDDRHNERGEILSRIASGQRLGSFETTRVRKDGRTIDVYVTISPVRDEHGRLIGLSTISRDITEQKTAQAALERQRGELQDFFENAVVGLHWVGPDGRIIWANRAEMDSLGYLAEEYIGHYIAEFHADAEVIDDILQRLGRNEKLHSYEARLRCKDGSLKHVLISSSVLWDEKGRFVHTRCFTVDVTARRLAEEALRRTEKMAATGRLAASIAHEINNPLEAVTNLLYLATHAKEMGTVATYLNQADAELKRVSHIARRTLGFFRDGSEERVLRFDELVADVISIYRTRIQARDITLDCDLSPVSVKGFEGELRQVVSNLLLNALDASGHGKRICVRVRSHSSHAACIIADEGNGIPAGDRSRIFEPFFTTKKDVGTGLGLWVSQEIVRKHMGRLFFRSSPQGKTGTVFRLTLPLANERLRASG